jgi:hypothetical protein
MIWAAYGRCFRQLLSRGGIWGEGRLPSNDLLLKMLLWAWL